MENGVRFIQICHAGGGNGAWDAHGDMKTHAPLCRAIDKPIAGLIRDLKQRGMLDATLVVFGSEFGRSPWSQNTTGRDHNPKGYSRAAGRRRRQGRHRSTAPPTTSATRPSRIGTTTATCTPRSCNQLGLDYKKMEHEVRRANLPPGGRRRRARSKRSWLDAVLYFLRAASRFRR